MNGVSKPEIRHVCVRDVRWRNARRSGECVEENGRWRPVGGVRPNGHSRGARVGELKQSCGEGVPIGASRGRRWQVHVFCSLLRPVCAGRPRSATMRLCLACRPVCAGGYCPTCWWRVGAFCPCVRVACPRGCAFGVTCSGKCARSAGGGGWGCRWRQEWVAGGGVHVFLWSSVFSSVEGRFLKF